MTEEQFTNVYLPRYQGSIQALARKLAKRDGVLYLELQQEGLVALWALDPAKARDNEDAWIRQALYNNMVSWLRRMRRSTVESLDSMIDKGVQLMQDEDGEIIVITPSVMQEESEGE